MAVLVSSTAVTVVAAADSAVAAPAVASVSVPGGIVVDGRLKRVFMGDRSAGAVVAADYTGARLGSVSGISGVSDLAVSDDGSTLYAAAEGSHEIVALDAATLTVKTRYAIATTTGPRHVAFSGGKVWFTYGDQWEGNLGSVNPAADPAGGTSPVALGQFPHPYPGLWSPAILSTNPGAPGVLAIGQTGVSTDSMAIVDVSGAKPQLTAWYQGDYSLNSGISDIDLVPGTPEVLVNGTSRDAYANGKFTAAGAYPGGQRADIDAQGLVAQVNGATVSVYRPGGTKPVHRYTVPSSAPADGSPVVAVKWAPDDSRLFTLAQTAGGYSLQVLTDPTLDAPALTVKTPSTATRGKRLTVTGKLSSAVPLANRATLSVTRTDTLSPGGTALPPVTVHADGSYSFTDVPPAGGTVTYKVAYAGDALHAPATASGAVSVPRTAPTLTLGNGGAVYDYGRSVTFTAHLGQAYRNRTVAIWAKPAGSDQHKKLLRTGTVNSHGDLSAQVTLTRNTDVTAVYDGDERTAAKSVTSRVWTRVRVSSTVSGAYRTGRIGSTPYNWFHKNTAPVVRTTMTSYPGRAHRLDLQVYAQGSWHSTHSEFFRLDTDGRSVVRLTAPGRSGIRARIRSVYAYGSSGDNVNASTYGPWMYLCFTD
ncbi:YncE family protein [Streptomyces sp. NPDC052396]|uniref:YncE family protein n=1 Tax=Streptomyces sp. NPDC052396 TaxID=3365689 RepID=UPI0037CCDC8A